MIIFTKYVNINIVKIFEEMIFGAFTLIMFQILLQLNFNK